jgi:hypothetical protein
MTPSAVPLAAIRELARLEARLPAEPGLLRAELTTPGLLLTLRAPVRVRGPFGLERRVTRISLGVDERERFLAAVGAARSAEAQGR